MVKFDLFGNSIISAGIDQKPVSPHVWKLWPSYIADGINIAESEKELQVMSGGEKYRIVVIQVFHIVT